MICIYMLSMLNMNHTNGSTQEVFVIPKLIHNLLGLQAITVLELVTKVDTIDNGKPVIQKKFPLLFSGLGKCLMNTSFASCR